MAYKRPEKNNPPAPSLTSQNSRILCVFDISLKYKAMNINIKLLAQVLTLSQTFYA